MAKGSSAVRWGWLTEVCRCSLWSTALPSPDLAELATKEHDLFLDWKVCKNPWRWLSKLGTRGRLHCISRETEYELVLNRMLYTQSVMPNAARIWLLLLSVYNSSKIIFHPTNDPAAVGQPPQKWHLLTLCQIPSHPCLPNSSVVNYDLSIWHSLSGGENCLGAERTLAPRNPLLL